MELLNEVDGDGDRGSFEDSDRFEEDDSVVSWSESESQINNWRGWDNIKTPLRPKTKKKGKFHFRILNQANIRH